MSSNRNLGKVLNQLKISGGEFFCLEKKTHVAMRVKMLTIVVAGRLAGGWIDGWENGWAVSKRTVGLAGGEGCGKTGRSVGRCW